MARMLNPDDLPADEKIMWLTANEQIVVPSFYVKELIMKLRGTTLEDRETVRQDNRCLRPESITEN